jgi:hypothetical protein
VIKKPGHLVAVYHSVTTVGLPVFPNASATINGQAVDWSKWADGGVYASPYISIRDGVMRVSDGRESYSVTFDGTRPVWRLVQ